MQINTKLIKSIVIITIIAIAASMISCKKDVIKYPEGGNEALKKLEQNIPQISDQAEDWNLGNGLITSAAEDGHLMISGDSKVKTAAWNTKNVLGKSWLVSLRVTLDTVYKDDGSAAVLMGNSKGQILFELKFLNAPAGFSKISFVTKVAGKEIEILNSGWMPGDNKEFFVTIIKNPETGVLAFQILGDMDLTYSFDIDQYQKQVSEITEFGFGVTQAIANMTNIAVNATYNMYGEYTATARSAVNDLIRNYWLKGPESGNIAPTWNGYISNILPDKRGGLWERGMIIFCLDSLYKVTGDPVLKVRISSEWRRMKDLYSIKEFEAAGSGLHPAVDDCGWHASLYLLCYEYTGDQFALDRAVGMIKNTYAFFMDDKLGGGMWYNSGKTYKSLYQVSVILSSFKIYEYTKNDEILQMAKDCYEWVEKNLLRDDDIYWCEVNENGPVGKDRPRDIKLAGSVSFLGGNMAISVAHARMYQMTGDAKYLDRAIRTVKGISTVFKTKNGTFLNDRDAWANGTFMKQYATEVLTLPGIPADGIDMVFKTAKSIYENDRTRDGYYGGCWDGPADGPGSKWSMIGSRPKQTMTSGSTVNMLIGASLLEALGSK